MSKNLESDPEPTKIIPCLLPNKAVGRSSCFFSSFCSNYFFFAACCIVNFSRLLPRCQEALLYCIPCVEELSTTSCCQTAARSLTCAAGRPLRSTGTHGPSPSATSALVLGGERLLLVEDSLDVHLPLLDERKLHGEALHLLQRFKEAAGGYAASSDRSALQLVPRRSSCPGVELTSDSAARRRVHSLCRPVLRAAPARQPQ